MMPQGQPMGMRTSSQSMMGGSPLLTPYRNFFLGQGLGALQDLDPYERLRILRMLYPQGRGKRPVATEGADSDYRMLFGGYGYALGIGD